MLCSLWYVYGNAVIVWSDYFFSELYIVLKLPYGHTTKKPIVPEIQNAFEI